MSKIVNLIKCKSSFKSNQPVSYDQIKAAERELALSFSAEYCSYLLTFGTASYFGHELTGICSSKRLNVVNVTLEQREFNPEIPKDWYVIEEAHIDGIVIWQNSKGNVFMSYPSGQITQVCSSLAEYIEKF